MGEDISDEEFALWLGILGTILVIMNVIAGFYLVLTIKRFRKESYEEFDKVMKF